MKQIFLKSFCARCLTLLVLALLSTNLAWGGVTELSESLDLTGKTAGASTYNSSTTYGDWTIVNGANNNKGWTYFKMGGKSETIKSSNPCYIYYSANSGVSSKVDKIIVSIAAGSLSQSGMSVNSWGVYVYSDKAMTTQIDYVAGGTITKNAATFEFTPSAGKTWGKGYYYKVSWDLANTTTTNGIVCVDKVTLYSISDAPDPVLQSIAIFGTPKATYETGESFDVTGLTVTGTYDDASTADLTSSAQWTINPATFTSTSQNSVSVTATVDGKTDTKSYDVTVNEHIVIPGEYTISLNNALYGIDTGNNDTEQSKKVNDITIISGCLSSASSKTYYDTNHIRYYKDSYLKLSVPDGYLITEVKFAATSISDWKGNITSTPDTYNADTKTWTGKSQNVDFNFGAQNRAASITVTYIRNKTLDHIGVEGTQTSFFVGDEFKHDGMTVTAYYDDETSEDVTSLATFSNPDMTSPGEKTVTVTYNEKTTSYKINVQAVVLTSVVVSGEPTKKEYYVGESFNTAGLVVTGHYNNGTQATITEGITWTITPETFTDITETSVTVTAKVGDVTSEDFEVTGLTVTSPESAYTLTAQPAEGGSYTVIVGEDPAKTVTLEAIEFKVTEGTVIQVEATAAEHYKVNSTTPFEGKYADETPITFGTTGVAKKKQFTYGTADATITAKFIRMYAVNIDENIEHGTVVADPVENTPSSVITLTLTPDAHYHFKSVTVKDKNGDNIATDTPETKDNITTTKFQMPSAEAKKGDVSVTATFEEDQKYTVTFSVNGVNTKSEPNYANTPVVFPEVSDVAGYTFIGWTTGPIAKTQDTKPATIIEAVYPKNNDKVYYAFFAEKKGSENYVKVTSVEDGLYLIVNEASSCAFNGKDAANGYVTVTISDGKISDANSAAILEIKSMTGGYSLKITNGENANKFIYGKSGSNMIEYGNEAVANEITFADGAATILSNDCSFRYNAASGNDRFRYYKTSTIGASYIVPALYKKQEATYSNYRTFVTHVPVTINKFVEKDEGNASFCSEFDLDFTGMDAEDKENKIGAYIGKDVVEGETAVLNLLGIDKVPAKTGIFVIGTPGTHLVPIYTGENELESRTDNSLDGILGEPYEVKENETIYALGKNDGLLHPVNTGVKIGVGKAYYRLPEDASSVSVLTLAIIDEPTGITSYENENDNKSTAVYNLQGMRVITPKKGEIYIMNGKKFLMK